MKYQKIVKLKSVPFIFFIIMMTAIGTLPITMGHGMDRGSSGNDFLMIESSNLGQEPIEQTDSVFTSGSHKVISSFFNRSYAEIVIEGDPAENRNYLAEQAAIPGYSDDVAYEMVNVDKGHNWIDKLDMPNPGQGVTAAIVDTGVHAHEDLMYRPDDTLRTMEYIDINWYYEGWWPFGHYVYQAWKWLVDTEDEWTSYSDYEHDSSQKRGVYDGQDHGTGTVGTFLRMAPYVDLIVVDYRDAGYSQFAYQWALELLHAWCDPDIVSCSWGWPAGWTGLENAVDDLVSDGETVMLACSQNFNTIVYYPAAYDNVMAIGAVNTRDEPDEGERSSYSNYGEELDVVAPGTPVYVPTQYDDNEDEELNDFRYKDGTSFSTPLVAGEAAETYQLLSNIRGSDPPSSVVKNFLKYHCDPGGQDTDPDDYSKTTSRQNDYYGHGIIDSWETLNFACMDDFQDYDTNSWSCHSITTAYGPRFDPYLYQGKMYMTDSSGDKVVAYEWAGIGDQQLRVNPDYDKYFSYYTKRSNGYTYAYHDFYPVYQDSNNYVKVRFYYRYLQVYRMYQGSLTKLYEEDVYSHTGWWCYDWQQVEIRIYDVYYPGLGHYLKLKIARRADGQTYTSGIITLAGPLAYNTIYMQGPTILAFRGGWASGNYGYALWDEIRVSQVPSGGLLG
ncbi:MAG: S8 family peptidase [Candidatus Thorarchaeota archaeon]